jgi:gliding motility-associated-like protein
MLLLVMAKQNGKLKKQHNWYQYNNLTITMRKLIAACCIVLINAMPSFSQYIVNGNANQINCHCYQLTPPLNTQAGSVWNSNKISLASSFDFSFDIFLGCNDANGADGIAFVLQPISTNVGTTGGGLGFEGIVPSLGILLDTWQNTPNNDPTYDHISINTNGNLNHNSANNIAGPVQIVSGNNNVEDCNWHVLRIVWDATLQQITAYIDGVQRVQANIDLVNTIFSGNPLVFWGFSAATGGSVNDQKFCTRLNAGIQTSITNNATCFGTPVTFTANIDAFIPITNYYWNFGDGTTATVPNPLPHSYAAPGPYTVKFAIKGADGCDSDTSTQVINIGAIPVASFRVNDTCFGNPINLTSTATITNNNTLVNYVWLVDGVLLANNTTISSSSYSVGNHIVKHLVKSNFGCSSDTVYGSFTVFPKPSTSFMVNDTCQLKPTTLTATAVGTNLIYNWIIDGNAPVTGQTYTNTFATGSHTVKHFVTNAFGCTSDTTTGTFNVYTIPTANFTVNDTCANLPITLHAMSTGATITYQWYVDGVPVSTGQDYITSTASVGVHTVKLVVTNNGKCSDEKNGTFTVFPKPILAGNATTVCLDSVTKFTATLTNPPISNLQYNWKFADNTVLNGITANKAFPTEGQGSVKLYATATSGAVCNSDTIIVNYNVIKAIANAGDDIVVGKNQLFNLQGSGNGSLILWEPNNMVSTPNSLTTSSQLLSSQLFTLYIETQEGCKASDKIYVTVVDTTVVYVPNIFTPNGDGKNDVLLPLYIGIKSLDYFIIYNRWGQKLFNTSNVLQGWNAQNNGKQQPNGTYVYQLRAKDILGKTIVQKGYFVILR